MDEKEFSVINVIPFIDIMLVLLTIVLTTSTFIARGAMQVRPPMASHNGAERLKTRIIEIDERGTIFLNSGRVGINDLRMLLADASRETPMLIRADRNTALQPFVDVMDALKNLGFARIALQTEERR